MTKHREWAKVLVIMVSLQAMLINSESNLLRMGKFGYLLASLL